MAKQAETTNRRRLGLQQTGRNAWITADGRFILKRIRYGSIRRWGVEDLTLVGHEAHSVFYKRSQALAWIKDQD